MYICEHHFSAEMTLLTTPIRTDDSGPAIVTIKSYMNSASRLTQRARSKQTGQHLTLRSVSEELGTLGRFPNSSEPCFAQGGSSQGQACGVG